MQRATESLASPFLCPEFAIAVDKVQPGARVAVLTDGSQIAGFFPFQLRRLGVGVPIGTPVNNCQGVIHEPGAEWDARDLLRACRLSAWQFDCLAEGQQSFRGAVSAVAPSPVINLADGYVAYREKLQANHPKFCKDLARRRRNLQREAGELGFVADTRDPAELRRLMAWKSEQYRRTGWIDFFDRPWIVDLVDDLFSTHTSHFGGLLSVLYAGQTPVAVHFGLRHGHVFAGCFPAYDVRFGRHSPGLILHLQRSEAIVSLGVRLIDMGKGPEHYKQTLKNHDLYVAEGMATRGPLHSAVHRRRTGVIRWAGPQLRKHPLLFHAADRVLRQFGRTT
jgi:CelD/BcsL family acetyltransferase involved in cellulose biosynthesis